jgi:hypothetical protein
MSVVLDYAWRPHPSVEAMRAYGVSGVVRYLSYLPNGKVIDGVEYLDLVNAGFDVAFVWERAADDFADPSFNAVSAAREALRQLAVIGAPDDTVIYYGLDWDVQAAQWATCLTKLRQVNAVHGASRTGLYGPYDALEWAKRDGVAHWFWQAGMSTAWSYGRNRNAWPGGLHLRQVKTVDLAGADVDVNIIHQLNYGQVGGDMLTPEDLKAITQNVACAVRRGSWRDGYTEGTFDPGYRGGPTLENVQEQVSIVAETLVGISERLDQLQAAPIDYDLLAAALVRRFSA